MTERNILRCAIYTRKSSEEGLEQDFNSLEAQREACEAFVRSQEHEGWRLLPDRFDDGGSMAIVDGAPNIIMLAGDITSATPLEFLRALKARPEARVLLLDSEGGLVDPGLVLAHEVHERALSTVVPVGADCLSACSFVYFAGKQRTVVGNLGVHQVWNEANDLVSGQSKLSDVLEALSDFGVRQEVISIMLRTPPQENAHLLGTRNC